MRKVFLLLALYLLTDLFCAKYQVFADKILTANSAVGSFHRSSKEPKYKIEFHPEDSPFHPEDGQESMIMPKQNGDKYLCFLPKVEKSKSEKLVTQLNTSSLIVETGKSIKLKTPDELLDLLKDRCFLRQEGWWTYEFCYQKMLRQLHIEDEKVIQEFVLGVYDEEATAAHNQNVLKDPLERDTSQRYHPHRYTNGTLCDLTSEPRETEVRFVCSEPRAMISSITELSTCKYALTVQIPMLCKHPLFKEERPVWYTIHCNALPIDHEEPKMEKKFQEEKINMLADIEYPRTSDSEE